MIYEKDGVRLTNNNPVCDSLFIKQGWIPVEEETEKGVAEKSVTDTENQQDKPVAKRTTKINK